MTSSFKHNPNGVLLHRRKGELLPTSHISMFSPLKCLEKMKADGDFKTPGASGHCSAFTTPAIGTVVRTCRLEASSSSSELEEGRVIDSDYLAARPNIHEKTTLKDI